MASGAAPTFTGTIPAQTPGTHILYAYAGDGDDATSINTGSSTGTSSSPIVGQFAAYLFTVLPAFTVPGPPTIGTAISGNAQASVTFSPPASDGGSAITSYTATSSTGGKTGTCVAPCTSITVTGLSNGTAYTFTVSATNGVGTGLPSQPSNSVTPGGPVPVLQNAVSRKTHGGASTFDLPLSLGP